MAGQTGPVPTNTIDPSWQTFWWQILRTSLQPHSHAAWERGYSTMYVGQNMVVVLIVWKFGNVSKDQRCFKHELWMWACCCLNVNAAFSYMHEILYCFPVQVWISTMLVHHEPVWVRVANVKSSTGPVQLCMHNYDQELEWLIKQYDPWLRKWLGIRP